MIRFIALTVTAVLLAAGTASAQVAAPSLNPTPTLRFAPGNPAVLPWDGPSRVGAAYGPLELADSAGVKLADGSHFAVGALWSGPTFTVGAQVVSISADLDPVTSPPGGSASIDALSFAVAAQFAGMYALGLAYEKSDQTDPGNDETETTPLFGATVRLGDVFYIGVAAGTATREDNLSPPDELKRSVLNYGIAYHWREKDRGLHIEYYHGNRQGVDDPLIGYNVDEDDTAGFTLEGIVANFLLGYQIQTRDSTDAAGIAQGSTKSTVITVGYVPAPGWSIVASLLSDESLDTAGVLQDALDVTSVGVALRF
jgi:hypothetical protein